MNLSVGIIGLPNVGKSTLFNALLRKQQAFVANYPFATIEPNIGVVPVPDERLEKLADIVERDSSTEFTPSNVEGLGMTKRRPPIVPAVVKFVDIAGLVKGANEGAGLGNKFLSHIREVSIIAHVVRAFEDPDIVRYEDARPLTRESSDGERGSVDPKTDYETIQTELILADLQTIGSSKLKAQSAKLQLKAQNEIIEKLTEYLNKGIPAREMEILEEEQEVIKRLFLLSWKPEIIVLNVSEKDYSEGQISKVIKHYSQVLNTREEKFTVISAKIEAELAELSEEDQKQYLKDLGLEQSGLERLIKKAYQALGLISFLTAGEKEVRGWTIRAGSTAITASGEIHTDFMKSFIKAEVVYYNGFVHLGGWKKAREIGKTRFEGRDYIMQDGDVVEFKIGQ